MISVLAAPRQKDSNSLRRAKMRSSDDEKASAAASASRRQSWPRISAATMLAAAVAFVYVFVPLPYSGPARIGSRRRAIRQHGLAVLFEINTSGRSSATFKSSTSSALSPEVVNSTDRAA